MFCFPDKKHANRHNISTKSGPGPRSAATEGAGRRVKKVCMSSDTYNVEVQRGFEGLRS